MTVHSKLEICNQQEQIIRCYKTKTFTGATNMAVIEDFILKKYQNCSLPLDIKILDQHDGYVTLDNDYLQEYIPFNTEKSNATTVQPTHSSETTVTLRITLPDHILYSITDRQDITTIEEALKTVVEQYQQIQRMDDVVSTPEPPKHAIPLYKDPKMGFINGHNVNDKQRDQYICDQVNVDTGETTGTLAMLQGEKTLANKYQSVLPRFKIWNDDIRNRADHVWTLLIYIVLDVCELGKRSLFSHPQRTFVKNANIREHSNPHEICITSADWMEDTGMELELRTVVIDGAKKHSNVSLNFICDLMDNDASNLSGSSCNYTKSRLALVLLEDTTIHWETLVISNEIVFKKKSGRLNITNILHIPNNTASSKRRRSKKCQTTSDQPFKRRKTQGVKYHSPLIDLLTNNNNFSVLPNPNLPISHRKNQTEVVEPGVISNILTVDAQTILNPTGIESSYGHSIDLMNIFLDDFDFSAFTNMDNSVLITGDPSLNLTASLDINSLDS